MKACCKGSQYTTKHFRADLHLEWTELHAMMGIRQRQDSVAVIKVISNVAVYNIKPQLPGA